MNKHKLAYCGRAGDDQTALTNRMAASSERVLNTQSGSPAGSPAKPCAYVYSSKEGVCCVTCGEYTERPRKSMCIKCYSRMRYATRPKKKKAWKFKRLSQKRRRAIQLKAKEEAREQKEQDLDSDRHLDINSVDFMC